MTMRPPALLCVAVLLPILVGCAQSPATRFLTLDAAPSTRSTVASYVGPPVQVQAVRLPADLDRMEVVQQTGPNTLRVDDFARWGAAPGELSRRALSLDLAVRLPAGALVFPSEPATPATRGLLVELVTLQDSPGGATLEARWTVVSGNAEGRSVLARGSKRLVIGSAGRGSDAVAAELTQLLGLLADAIAADLAAGAPAA